MIDKECLVCGRKFSVPNKRRNAKYCGIACRGIAARAKPNMVCSVCGKEFHSKQSHIDSCKGDLGLCCSKVCQAEQMRIRMTGIGNHQYGLKGHLNASFKSGNTMKNNGRCRDEFVYVGHWYKRIHENGRIRVHRYLVELNHEQYDDSFFDLIDGWWYLKDKYDVHHIDHNHSNNELSNLMVLTRGEHTRLHNLVSPRNRDSKTGKFIK